MLNEVPRRKKTDKNNNNNNSAKIISNLKYFLITPQKIFNIIILFGLFFRENQQ